MQLGAAWAGLAIENSMLGAAHALANPLTAQYGISHGQAVGVMLPHVVRFNGLHHTSCDRWYHELLGIVGEDEELQGLPASERLAIRLTRFLQAAHLKPRLRELGVASERLSELARDAASQWTGTFNPVPVDESSLRGIYEQAF